jgi:predicted ATPase/DNA-binding SARP family transcriptional activator
VSSLELFLLGSPRLERDGRPVELQYRKNVALLAYLAVAGQGPGSERYTRESLITLLWPELEPSRGRANLRRNLSVLRKALGAEWLLTDRETVGLNPTAELWVDVQRFRSRLRDWREHSHPEDDVCPDCLITLAEAVELYRGDFMAGFTLPGSPAFDEWQFFQTEGLRQGLAAALEHLVRGYGAQGELETAIPYARRWLALDPLHEPAHRSLMQLYDQAGQRAAALRQYEECARILQEELGLAPAQETTSLYEQIRTSALGREEPAAPQPPHNLPTQPTPFVGRETVLAQIGERLGDPDCRLLTLVGPGGSGKTRLALEAAGAQLENFQHGVFFVSLAPLRSAEAIAPTVAEAVGFCCYGDARDATPLEPRQQLLEVLRRKRMLLVMDNFEHLLAGAGLVAEMLDCAPGIRILATSRARLHVQAEHLFPVGGMDLPPTDRPLPIGKGEGQYSAVKLFSASARRVRPDFQLADGNVADVVRICRLVEGMPLGIVLAAAWIGMLTPAEIAAEIGTSLDFLETDLRGVPERQRSIRAVFDHSWKLLTEREREIFQGLSIFRGGFNREAAQAVTGASLRELVALADKSLLHRMPTGRYEVHELLRQYAEEALDRTAGAGEPARDRHSAHYAAALERWAGDLKGGQQQAALAEMEEEIENVHVAWDWAVERGQQERIDQGIEGLGRFCEWRGRWVEGEAACRAAAERLSRPAGEGTAERARIRARALAWQGRFGWRLGHIDLAAKVLRQSLALLGKSLAPERAFVLFEMGLMVHESDPEEARPLYEESLALYRALGDRWSTAYVLEELGWLCFNLCTYREGKRLFEESLAIRQSLYDRRGIARSLFALGITIMSYGQFDQSERLLRKSIALCRKVGEQPILAEGLLGLAQLFVYGLGRFDEAHQLIDEGEAIFADLGWRDRIALSGAVRGYARMHQGQYGQARALADAALAIAREVGHRPSIAFALAMLGETALAEERYDGIEDLLEEAVAIDDEIAHREGTSWALPTLGYALRALGQPSRAWHHLSTALRVGAEIGSFPLLVTPLPGIAMLLADQGETERAVELYALASRYPTGARSRWYEDVVGRHIAAAAATLPPDVVAAAQERGRARDLAATVAELLAELGSQPMGSQQHAH